jgi:predicted RNA-binding protein with PUA-like domain
MNYWLVKQEPDSYPFAQLLADGKTDWTGVRNYQARNFLRAMEKGDHVLYYHSGKDKAVVGTATVARAAFADPTAEAADEGWVAVEIRSGKALKLPVPLAAIKADPQLGGMLLVRHSRLSVMPVTQAEYEHILALALSKR